VPKQVPSQQTPSTQLPEAQTAVGLQAAPGPSFAEHMPVLALQ
jgi:hypothetical protein